MKSIISNKRECYFCKTTINLHKHHIFKGSYRENAERYGLWVYLCINHHTAGKDAVHRNSKIDKALMKLAQKEFEKIYTREKFMKLFGISNL